MDPIVLYPSLIFGVILIVLHLLQCHKKKKPVNLGVMINSVLSGSGVVCGLLLLIGSFSDQIMKRLTGINVYIFIAGLAVCYVSAQTIYKDIVSNQDKDENNS
jgi:hypothetical protein